MPPCFWKTLNNSWQHLWENPIFTLHVSRLLFLLKKNNNILQHFSALLFDPNAKFLCPLQNVPLPGLRSTGDVLFSFLCFLNDSSHKSCRDAQVTLNARRNKLIKHCGSLSHSSGCEIRRAVCQLFLFLSSFFSKVKKQTLHHPSFPLPKSERIELGAFYGGDEAPWLRFCWFSCNDWQP